MNVDKVISVSGSIKAKYSAPLIFQSPGIVKNIFVGAGSRVLKNQPLIQLRDDHTKVQIRWANVQLAAKKADYQRSKEMYEKKIWSYAQVEKAQTEMASASLEVEKAKVNDDNMRITAPFTGHVGFFQTNGKQLSPGSSVQQGQEVGKIVSDETIVEFELSEIDAEQVKVGQKVLIQMEGEGILPLASVVSAKEPFSDPVSHMVKFNANLSEKNTSYQDGTFVKVAVTLKDAAPALLVPTEAVIPDSGQYLVYVVKDSGEIFDNEKIFIAKAVSVTPGPQLKGLISIGEKLRGVEKGDLVITEPAEMVKDGLPVILTKE
ncbi:efflux RND transporter periplasmic adaptor subunit [Holospora curviuscula]|nr:efflux RND transporter periplasmic adaptor subunit [Holospora curviuscula]